MPGREDSFDVQPTHEAEGDRNTLVDVKFYHIRNNAYNAERLKYN